MSQYPNLYSSSRWKLLRSEQLRNHPFCKFCEENRRITSATVADHVIPHRGDRALFYDGELQSLCKQCHDSIKQRIETKGYHNRVDEFGFPIDPNHPLAICDRKMMKLSREIKLREERF